VAVAVAVAMHSDVPLVAMASRALYSELLAGGVRIYEYPISMLHSKVAVIDDLWAIVGSYNLDHRSLRHNLEGGLLTLDKPFATALRSQIMIDLAHCREVRRHAHETRPWNRALSEVLAYQLRYWL
jgi:cardiolipin synthase